MGKPPAMARLLHCCACTRPHTARTHAAKSDHHVPCIWLQPVEVILRAAGMLLQFYRTAPAA